MKLINTTRTSKKVRTTTRKNGRTAIVTAAKKNRISEVVYETAKDLHASGAVSQTTMREFDALCLPKVSRYTPKQIKAIRDRCNASQKVFAAYMNTSPSALQKWETGTRKPDNIALKLISLIDKKGLEALL
jgi:putative transcriptional regulator